MYKEHMVSLLHCDMIEHLPMSCTDGQHGYNMLHEFWRHCTDCIVITQWCYSEQSNIWPLIKATVQARLLVFRNSGICPSLIAFKGSVKPTCLYFP